MYRMTRSLYAWLQALFAPACPPDPLARLTLRDYADLPVSHPGCETWPEEFIGGSSAGTRRRRQ